MSERPPRKKQRITEANINEPLRPSTKAFAELLLGQQRFWSGKKTLPQNSRKRQSRHLRKLKKPIQEDWRVLQQRTSSARIGFFE
jgi:hypothetical protein